MNEYQYQPVDEATSEVRFLVLLPGERGDPIEGMLFNAPLTEERFPDYEALSYVWGSLDDPVHIAIRSTDRPAVESGILSSKSNPPLQFDKLPVTQNLGRALPYLRLRDEPRLLWIDAICVNQKNLTERSAQVQRMADVYRLASRVVVWLGEESPTSNLAMNTLKTIRSKLSFDLETHTISPTSEDPSEAHVRVSMVAFAAPFISHWRQPFLPY